jgi:hypothetical protein
MVFYFKDFRLKFLYAFLFSLILYFPYSAENITNSKIKLLLMVNELRLYVVGRSWDYEAYDVVQRLPSH